MFLRIPQYCRTFVIVFLVKVYDNQNSYFIRHSETIHSINFDVADQVIFRDLNWSRKYLRISGYKIWNHRNRGQPNHNYYEFQLSATEQDKHLWNVRNLLSFSFQICLQKLDAMSPYLFTYEAFMNHEHKWFTASNR